MELNYKEFGQGDPIVILHGLFGTLDNWQTMAKQLANDYTVIIVDQRNHGRSPHAEEINYSLMAEDLKELLENNWIYKTRIIGHSMGGKTAMEFALNYPDLVEQLAVIDIGPKAYKGNHESIFEALERVELDKIEGRKEADGVLAETIEDSGVRQFLLKNLSRNKEGGYRWKMNLPALRKHYNDILANVKGDEIYDGPTLFVGGGQSNYISQEDLPEINKLFPMASMEIVEKSGHWIHAEAPKELYSLLTRFFKTP